ncbi:phage tail spike protein [Hominilimicola sp.]|uniref:phage tail spike protein n=1 Tax=Hominilimicola sp. TaxID=3073571 RepID=UPI0039954DF9
MAFKLHEWNETDFTGGCLAYLNKAYEVAVYDSLQEVPTVSFKYPMKEEKADLIQEYRIVSVEGQAYRITTVKRDYSGSRIMTVKANRIFYEDAMRHHFTTIGNDTDVTKSTIGVDPYDVIKLAIADTKFELISDSELKKMGMTRIGADGVKIDFYPTDKINTYDVIQNVIEAYGRGEIYYDNYRFAVVERIGKDNGVRMSIKKNMTSLSVERNTQELTTRLYMYGKDDLTISSVNGGKPYIESEEGIEKYGIREAYRDYSDYDDPEKLKAFGEWDLKGEGNDFRLDRPQLTITGDVVDLSKLAEYGDFYKIALGDTVHVFEGDIEHKKRIVSMKYYPYSAKQPSVTIGQPTLANPYYHAWYMGKLLKTVQKNSGRANKLKTSYFHGTVNSTQNPVESDNKKLLLDGDLLIIKDSQRDRIHIGNDEVDNKKQFVFLLYDVDGNPVIFFDEKGNGIFSGTIRGAKIESDTDINVNKDASVGQYLRVGYISSYVNDEGKTIYKWSDESGILLSGYTSIKTTNGGNNLAIGAMSSIELNATKVMQNGNRLLNTDDLKDIMEEIRQLKAKISELEN